MANYTCPVCGYDELEDPPSNWNICDSCGTEFGYHDARISHEELRRRWVANGARWHSPDFPPPIHWSAIEQRDQDVAGLEIAVNDALLVGVLDGFAHRQKQL